ncbi:hypothetical protein C5C95_13845, partial [Rathayibacter sp. AY1B7]
MAGRGGVGGRRGVRGRRRRRPVGRRCGVGERHRRLRRGRGSDPTDPGALALHRQRRDDRRTG